MRSPGSTKLEHRRRDRRHAAGEAERVLGALERRELLLEHPHGRVVAARIDRRGLLAAIGRGHLVVAGEGEERGLARSAAPRRRRRCLRHGRRSAQALVERGQDRASVICDISLMSSSTMSRIFERLLRAPARRRRRGSRRRARGGTERTGGRNPAGRRAGPRSARRPRASAPSSWRNSGLWVAS